MHSYARVALPHYRSHDCTLIAVQVQKAHPTANGATWMSTTKNCWAEFDVTGVLNTAFHKAYKTCRFEAVGGDTANCDDGLACNGGLAETCSKHNGTGANNEWANKRAECAPPPEFMKDQWERTVEAHNMVLELKKKAATARAAGNDDEADKLEEEAYMWEKKQKKFFKHYFGVVPIQTFPQVRPERTPRDVPRAGARTRFAKGAPRGRRGIARASEAGRSRLTRVCAPTRDGRARTSTPPSTRTMTSSTSLARTGCTTCRWARASA